MFAAWRLGAAVTPVNPALTAQEARYQIDDAGATLVVADDTAAAALRHGPGRVIALEECATRRPTRPPPLVADPEALALLIYTSGRPPPKGVMLDHANVGATARIIIDWFEMTGDTRSLLVLAPVPRQRIMVSVVSPLLAGGSAFVADGSTRIASGPRSRRSGPVFFSAVPTIYAMLTSRPGPPPDTGACASSSAAPPRCRAS